MFRYDKTVLIPLTSPNTNSRPTVTYSVPVTSLDVFEEVCLGPRDLIVLEINLGHGMRTFRRLKRRIAFTVQR
jgi:hypothetical protein